MAMWRQAGRKSRSPPSLYTRRTLKTMRTIEDKNIPSRGGGGSGFNQVLSQVQLIQSLPFVQWRPVTVLARTTGQVSLKHTLKKKGRAFRNIGTEKYISLTVKSALLLYYLYYHLWLRWRKIKTRRRRRKKRYPTRFLTRAALRGHHA